MHPDGNFDVTVGTRNEAESYVNLLLVPLAGVWVREVWSYMSIWPIC